MKFEEGKAAISLDSFRRLCEIALTQRGDFDLGATVHSYLTMNWNLINRSVSTGVIALAHLDWDGDTLTVCQARSKCDQEGSRAARKHVFANPEDPILCPILALAVMLFSRSATIPRTDEEKRASPLLYGRPGTEKRFGGWLETNLRKYKEEMELMGVRACDIGTHSFRRGVTTTLASMEDGLCLCIVKIVMVFTSHSHRCIR